VVFIVFAPFLTVLVLRMLTLFEIRSDKLQVNVSVILIK